MDALKALKETVARLRAPGGCPWDREQTHQSICDCLIEEVSELLDTIDRNDMAHMREELGDLLLHVVMHAQMAEEKDHFDLEEVAKDINEKLIRRHPHVFGHMDLGTSDEVLEVWDKIKASEKKNGPTNIGVFKELPTRLPALLFAREVYKQIVKKNLDAASVLDENYINSLSDGLSEETAGRMLFEMAAACRQAKIDPESALRRHSQNVIDKINEGTSKS
jgi:MazG family protein